MPGCNLPEIKSAWLENDKIVCNDHYDRKQDPLHDPSPFSPVRNPRDTILLSSTFELSMVSPELRPNNGREASSLILVGLAGKMWHLFKESGYGILFSVQLIIKSSKIKIS